MSRTANKYLVSPMRSKYRRQNGKVPKFLLIVFNNDFAEVSLIVIKIRMDKYEGDHCGDPLQRRIDRSVINFRIV